MQSSMLLILTGASSVLGTCFTGGERWASDVALALAQAEDVCNTKFSHLTWSPNQALPGCYDLNGGRYANYILQRISDSSGTISVDECYDGFQKEINGCQYGGSTPYTNWKYTADPNAGGC